MSHITIEKVAEFKSKYGRFRCTSGFYGLVDPREMFVRYVGSSECIERRLYQHIHHSQPSKPKTPKEKWVYELKNQGVFPIAIVLKIENFEQVQKDDRHNAEREWIEFFHLTGEADLNMRLTPIGHTQSLDSKYKIRLTEFQEMKETNKKLLAENEILKLRILALEAQVREVVI